jgi:hypothetical protein
MNCHCHHQQRPWDKAMSGMPFEEILPPITEAKAPFAPGSHIYYLHNRPLLQDQCGVIQVIRYCNHQQIHGQEWCQCSVGSCEALVC